MPAKVDADSCTGCHSCEEACPQESIKMADDIAVVDKESCIDCAACVDACPTHSMTMED
jgi:NAD-dependent dihydropyrimidine dehydrogenase PreA subunit